MLKLTNKCLQIQSKTTTKQNSVELEASLAPAEAEVGAEARADQKSKTFLRLDQLSKIFIQDKC